MAVRVMRVLTSGRLYMGIKKKRYGRTCFVYVRFSRWEMFSVDVCGLITCVENRKSEEVNQMMFLQQRF